MILVLAGKAPEYRRGFVVDFPCLLEKLVTVPEELLKSIPDPELPANVPVLVKLVTEAPESVR